MGLDHVGELIYKVLGIPTIPIEEVSGGDIFHDRT